MGRARMAGLVGVVVLGLSGTALAVAGSGTPGFPGGPGFCPEELEPCGDPITLATGEHLGRPVEIVAYSSAVGLCVDIVRGRSTAGICQENPAPRGGHRYAPISYGVRNGRRPSSDILAALAPDISRVRVRYKRNGEWKRAATLLGQITDEDLEQLDVPGPFGVLVASLRGCQRRQRYRLRASDANGAPLGAGQLRRAPLGCRPKGGTTIVIGASTSTPIPPAQFEPPRHHP